jgi:hypothetical protein
MVQRLFFVLFMAYYIFSATIIFNDPLKISTNIKGSSNQNYAFQKDQTRINN